MAQLKLGLALGAGGARGWCHIGVLRALEEMGIRPDVIAGCSMGALVGAVYAGGKLDGLEAWLAGFTRARMMRYLDVSPSSGGLVAGREISRLLTELGMAQTIDELAIPFASVATDFDSGAEVWLQKGSVVDAVRASSALPGVISPHMIDCRWHMDGGLVNPVPVSLCRAMGADVVIAVDPNAHMLGRPRPRQPTPRPSSGYLLGKLPRALRERFRAFSHHKNLGPPAPHYFDVVYSATAIVSDRSRLARLAGDPPHVLLNADLQHLPLLDLYRSASAIAEGHRIAVAQAEWIRKYADQVKPPRAAPPSAPDAT